MDTSIIRTLQRGLKSVCIEGFHCILSKLLLTICNVFPSKLAGLPQINSLSVSTTNTSATLSWSLAVYVRDTITGFNVSSSFLSDQKHWQQYWRSFKLSHVPKNLMSYLLYTLVISVSINNPSIILCNLIKEIFLVQTHPAIGLKGNQA